MPDWHPLSLRLLHVGTCWPAFVPSFSRIERILMMWKGISVAATRQTIFNDEEGMHPRTMEPTTSEASVSSGNPISQWPRATPRHRDVSVRRETVPTLPGRDWQPLSSVKRCWGIVNFCHFLSRFRWHCIYCTMAGEAAGARIHLISCKAQETIFHKASQLVSTTWDVDCNSEQYRAIVVLRQPRRAAFRSDGHYSFVKSHSCATSVVSSRGSCPRTSRSFYRLAIALNN